jgi:hypothetical protein
MGTQFPDLLGKPLAWTFGVLPSGRSLFHSLFTCILILGGLWYAAKQRESRKAMSALIAFAVGYLSHLLSDGLNPLLNTEFSRLSFLLWPLLPTPNYETKQSFVAHFTHIETSLFFLSQFLLLLIAGLLWLRDDTPGYKQVYETMVVGGWGGSR